MNRRLAFTYDENAIPAVSRQQLDGISKKNNAHPD